MGIFQNLIKYNVSNDAMESIIKALLLLVLSISGNFLAETLGCQSQTLLDNMVAKHLLILFMIYFTIDFTDKEHVNPFINLVKAFAVWIIFHFFTHMDIMPTVISICIVMILFFISNYRHYLSKNNKEENQNNNNLDNNLKIIQQVIAIGSLCLILVSSGIYYLEKKTEYNKHFSVWKFIFGVKKCKHSTPSKAKFFNMKRK